MIIKKPADLMTAAVILIGVGFIYRESLNIDTTIVYALGPLFFPKILMFALAFLSILLALKSIDFSSKAVRGKGEPAKGKATITVGTLFMQFVFVGMIILYLLIMPLLGYIASTVLFLLAEMLFLGKRTLRGAALCLVAACVTTGLLYYVFAHLLYLFLP